MSAKINLSALRRVNFIHTLPQQFDEAPLDADKKQHSTAIKLKNPRCRCRSEDFESSP